MILCEVALGVPKIGPAYGQPISLMEADVTLPNGMPLCNQGNVILLPNDDYQSIQASPTGDSISYQEIDGVRIANGNVHIGASNQFVVFDPNQVKIKYLFKMKFF